MALSPQERSRRMRLNMLMAMSYAVAGRTTFTPSALFAAGEQGVWYDPSDFSTMFQDSAGTTPVTAVEQPVGLILDKSKGLVLGNDVVTNGTFDADASWTKGAGWTISGGVAAFNAGAGFSSFRQDCLTIGKSYKIQFDLTWISGEGVRLDVGGVQMIANNKTSGRLTVIAVAVASTRIQFANGISGAANFTIDNVTAVEIPGNHASQSTSASRPVLSARVNQFIYSEQLNLWSSLGNGSISTDTTTAPDGTTTAETLTASAATGAHGRFQGHTYVAGAYTLSICAKAGTYSFFAVDFNNTGNQGAVFDLSNGTIGFTDSGVTSAITSLGNGWYRCTVTRTMSAGSGFPEFYLSSSRTSNGRSFAAAGTETVFVWGADLRVTNDGVGLPAYQRVAAATDYDTTGYNYYLRFDGTDDSLATAAIDFSASDKMSVFAGVRKLSDAARGMVLELGTGAVPETASNFNLNAPVGASAGYAFRSTGTASGNADLTTGYTSPITNVLTGLGTISGDLATLRINGVQAAQATTDQGTGNYGNYALYIGRRGGSTLPANMRLYSLIVRGAWPTAAELANTETYTNNLTKAY